MRKLHSGWQKGEHLLLCSESVQRIAKHHESQQIFQKFHPYKARRFFKVFGFYLPTFTHTQILGKTKRCIDFTCIPKEVPGPLKSGIFSGCISLKILRGVLSVMCSKAENEFEMAYGSHTVSLQRIHPLWERKQKNLQCLEVCWKKVSKN